MTKISANQVIPLVYLAPVAIIPVKVYPMGAIQSQAASGLLAIYCVIKTGQLLTNNVKKGILIQGREYVHQRLTKVSLSDVLSHV